MGRIITTQINAFHGGISDDPRENTSVKFQITKHFDIFSSPNKLVPYRSTEADTNDGSTATGMKQYLIRTGLLASDGKFYGLGVNGSSNTKVAYKSTPQSGNWTLPASSEGNGAPWRDSFFEYKNYIWGFQGTTSVFKYGDITGTPSITNAAGTVGTTITSTSNGVVAADDQGYIGYNNKIVRIAADGTVTDAVLTLPTNLKITSLENYGNYLAIGCAPKDSTTTGFSRVFLWDLVSDDVQESIDWGEGSLQVLGNIEGRLVGVSDKYISSDLSANAGSIVIRMWAGGAPQVVEEILAKSNTTNALLKYKAIKNNKLYFLAKIPTSASENNYGIFVFGRRNVNYQFGVTLDTIQESATSYEGFATAGNLWFIFHNNDGSIAKTDDTATFSFTSIYESQIFGGLDSSLPKRIVGTALTYEPLTSGQSVTLKYRLPGASTWNTIFSDSTAGNTAHESVNIESNGDAFTDGYEFEFRVESTGGAVVTGLKVVMEELAAQLNTNNG